MERKTQSIVIEQTYMPTIGAIVLRFSVGLSFVRDVNHQPLLTRRIELRVFMVEADVNDVNDNGSALLVQLLFLHQELLS